MRLYRCEVRVDVMVLAQDERAAQDIAIANVKHETGFARCWVGPVKDEDDLGNGWATSVPYARKSSDHMDRTCRDIIRGQQEAVAPSAEPQS